jgi:hypothetical protein
MVAPITTAALRFATEPVLNEHFDDIYEKHPAEWSQLFEVKAGMQRRFYEMARFYGFGLAVEKAEGGAITYDTAGEFYRTRVLYRRWNLAFAITEDAVDDAEHLSIGTDFSEHLAISMAETKEIVHADIFNRAINGSYVGGDGVSLLSASHPLGGGGTASNYLASTDLSDFALKQILIQIRTAGNERGHKIALRGRRLIVAPDNEYAAIEILQSDRLSGTANNNINSLRVSRRLEMTDPFVLTRLTSTRAWFVQTNSPKGLLHRYHPRGKLKRGMEGDFETGNLKYKSSERYAALWDNWRTVYGSMGS